MTTGTAVHFGAGNIGRGFVGLLLHEAGFRLVFADVASELIASINAAGAYRVLEVGPGARDHDVSGVSGIDSGADAEALFDEISRATVVTTAVGPNILRFVAPAIAEGIARRAESAPPLVVMACENAINATDRLREEIVAARPDVALDGRAVFANTAVDRIVPGQPEGQGLDVTVEAYCEWVIEQPPLAGADLDIPGATFVDELGPYIERKLFTVNTGHATIAYHGAQAGAETIAEAIALPAVEAEVRAVLGETAALLVAKHGIDAEVQAAYVDKNVVRFTNPHLPDTVLRVGREPLRKLSRHERFIGPAAEIAENGGEPAALVRAIGAALAFRSDDDPQAVELAQRLDAVRAGSETPEAFVESVTGIGDGHPLFAALVALVRA
ncbi:MAG: mannitol-1-phosphate 5-dehydrogenase [Leifsonia sp.]|nr:mannitol-1-phosphate 5-dehydrogenase [Leifsonia sp.]